MALELRTTTAFERDLRRVKKQGKDLDEMEQARETLPARCRPHPLRGHWLGHWDCNVQPDWIILLYKLTDRLLILVRTGSHAELFGR